MRSPRFWVSGYCTKWGIQGSFDSSQVTFVKKFNLGSILTDKLVRYVFSQHKLCTGRTEHSRWNLISTFRRSLTNGSDVHMYSAVCTNPSLLNSSGAWDWIAQFPKWRQSILLLVSHIFRTCLHLMALRSKKFSLRALNSERPETTIRYSSSSRLQDVDELTFKRWHLCCFTFSWMLCIWLFS